MSIFALRAFRAGLGVARPLAGAVVARVAVAPLAARGGLVGSTAGTRLFSVCAPALFPVAKKKTPVKKKTPAKKPAPKKKVVPKKKTVAKRKPAARRVTARKPKPKTRSTTRAKVVPKKRGPKKAPLTLEQRIEKRRLAYEQARNDTVKAIPKPPKQAPTAYALFVQKHYAATAAPGATSPAASAALSKLWAEAAESEKAQLASLSKSLQLTRAAAYDKWARHVGYLSLRKLNADRVRKGKKKLAIPASIRPATKPTAFFNFLKEKRDGHELNTALAPSGQAKQAGELWRALTDAQKESYKK